MLVTVVHGHHSWVGLLVTSLLGRLPGIMKVCPQGGGLQIRSLVGLWTLSEVQGLSAIRTDLPSTFRFTFHSNNFKRDFQVLGVRVLFYALQIFGEAVLAQVRIFNLNYMCLFLHWLIYYMHCQVVNSLIPYFLNTFWDLTGILPSSLLHLSPSTSIVLFPPPLLPFSPQTTDAMLFPSLLPRPNPSNGPFLIAGFYSYSTMFLTECPEGLSIAYIFIHLIR